jgi:carboxyl-terminal processing protease
MKPMRVGAILLVTAMSGALTVAQEAPRTDYTELFHQMWRAVNEKFYDPNFAGVNWESVRANYEPKVAVVHTDIEFAAEMNRMLHELPVTHVGVKMPGKEGQAGIAVTTIAISGKQVVASVDSPSDALRVGLRPGEVVLTDRSDVRGDWGTVARLQIEDCAGRVRAVSLHREPVAWPPTRPSIRWRVLRPSPQRKIGYMQVADFEDDVRDDFAPLVDQAMNELRETDGLIVDIRNNPGGNLSALRLVSYFSPDSRFAVALLSRPFFEHLASAADKLPPETIAALPRVVGAYSTPKIIEAMRSNGGGAAFYTESGLPQYRGKIVVLLNEKTASAAEGFAGIIKGYPNVTLVGRTTMGAMVGAESFAMAGGWTLRFPTHASWRADGRSWRDEPVVPDVSVPLTREDLCNGRDSDIAKAFELLGYN